MTAVDDRPKTEIGSRAQAQGGPAPHHRSDQVDRQHPAPGDAAPGHGAQPVRPCHHHRHRHLGGARKSPGVLAVLTGEDVKDIQGGMANAWPITEDQKAPVAPGDRGGPRRLRRRDRRRRGRPDGGGSPRRRRAGRRGLRRAAPGARPQGGRDRRGAGPPQPGHEQERVLAVRLPGCGDGWLHRRGHRARPAPTASSSSASTASSGSSPRSWSPARSSATRRASS